MPRIQILLTLTAIALSGLATPVIPASASTSETPALVATIDVGAGTTPYGIAVTPDGSKVFVSNSTGGSVSEIDTASRAVTNTITSNIGSTPVGIAISPSGTTAYVGNYTAGTITQINTATGVTSATSIVPSGVFTTQCNWVLNLTASNDGTKLFVACQDDSNVQVLSLPSLTLISTLANTTNNCFPTDSAVTSDDSTLVVAVNGPGPAPGVFPCDASIRDTALIIDVAAAPTGNTYVPATNGAFSVAISPSSGLAYLAGQSSGAIAVVNLSTRSSAGANIPVGGSLTDIVITPDGSQAIVSVIDEDVVKFIDLVTGAVTHTVGVGGTDPQSIALSRDGRFLYTANRSGSVGVIEVPVPPASGDQVPTAPMQQFARADTDFCDAQPDNLVDFPGLGGLRHKEWGPSWAQWTNGGTGGFVCTRQPYYTSAGAWNVR